MPFFASAARFCACLMSPENPTAKQISPVASALRYSDEWNLRTSGRIVDHQIGGLLQVRLARRVGIEAEIAQRRRQDVVGGIQHVDAAILELARDSPA